MLKVLVNPNQCLKCRKIFKYKHHLQRHGAKKKSCISECICVNCHKEFECQDKLQKHLKVKKCMLSINVVDTIDRKKELLELEIRKLELETGLAQAKTEEYRAGKEFNESKSHSNKIIQHIGVQNNTTINVNINCSKKVFDLWFVDSLGRTQKDLHKLISHNDIPKTIGSIVKDIIDNPKYPENRCLKKTLNGDKEYVVYYADKGWVQEDFQPNVKSGVLNILDDSLRPIEPHMLSKNKRKIYDKVHYMVIKDSKNSIHFIKNSMDIILPIHEI